MQYLPTPEHQSQMQMQQLPQMAQMPQGSQLSQMQQMPQGSQVPQMQQMRHGSQVPQMSQMQQMPQMLQIPQMPVPGAHPNFSPSPHMVPLQYDCYSGGRGMPIRFEVTPPPPVACPLTLPELPLPELPRHSRSKKRRLRPCGAKSDAGGSEEMYRMLEPLPPRKSKSSYGTGSVYDEDNEDLRSVKSSSDKRQNHSEIEKRRRDKMNNYISELATMVPMCATLARKLDKLTVLRMTVQHLRAVRGSLNAGPLTVRPPPSVLSESEINALVLKAATNCFVMVIGCERGRIMYVSTSITRMLNYKQSDLFGQSFFDLLHPKDVAKVKEQMSSNSSPRDRFIDAKTMLPLRVEMMAGASRLSPGSRRSFICRVKCQIQVDPEPSMDDALKEEPGLPRRKFDKKYCLISFTGFLKSWAPADITEDGEDMESDTDTFNMPCLVAVGRALPDIMPEIEEDEPPPPGPVAKPARVRPLEFMSRHSPDGNFVFIDLRVTLVLGYLPHEMVGTSVYEYVDPDQAPILADAHRACLQKKKGIVETTPYKFRRKDGTQVTLRTQFKHLINPCTKEMEFLVANNIVMPDDPAPVDVKPPQPDADNKEAIGEEVKRMLGARMAAHKFGTVIVNEAFRRGSPASPELSVDLLHDAVFSQQPSLVESLLNCEISIPPIRNNVSLSEARGNNTPPPDDTQVEIRASPTPPPASPPLTPISFDENGDATMAVLMNLLESEAGFEGPANFNGMPWMQQ